MSVQANNLVVTGGNFTTNISRDISLMTNQKLYEHVAKDAFYNSQERTEEANFQTVHDIANEWTPMRFQHLSTISLSSSNFESLPPPPSRSDQLQITAEGVVNDILTYLHNISSRGFHTLWLYDDDRRLTSLVAQVVSEVLAKQQKLSAAYFFPNSGPGKLEPDVHRVLPTIAYQLAQRIPAVKPYIMEALEADMSIFNLKIHDQIEKLVVDPLKRASEKEELFKPPNVILIHVLEICDKGDVQSFLAAFTRAIVSIHALPGSQRLLILGQPTVNLRESFSKRTVLQRPMRHKDWIAREQDISRREVVLNQIDEDPRALHGECSVPRQGTIQQEERREDLLERMKAGLERVRHKDVELTRGIERLQQRERRLSEEEKRKRQEMFEQEQKIKKAEDKLQEDAKRLRNHLAFPKGIMSFISGRRKSEIIVLIGRSDTNLVSYFTQNATGWTTLEGGSDIVYPVEIDNPSRLDKSIVFISTPGYSDKEGQPDLSGSPHLTRMNTLWTVRTWLRNRYGKGVKVSGIIYHHPIGICYDGEGKAMRDFQAFCRELIWVKMDTKVLLVVTTKQHTVLHREARDEQMKARFDQWKAALEWMGARVDLFDKTPASAWRIVEWLLTKR